MHLLHGTYDRDMRMLVTDIHWAAQTGDAIKLRPSNNSHS